MGYILDGVYHKDPPDLSKMKTDRTTVDKQFEHDAQRRRHQAELVQPYKQGKPNPEFVQLYPEESKKYGFV